MHIVSDLQQRPRKGRLRLEKRIIPFYDICTLVQLVTLLIHTVTTVLAANRTFTYSIFSNNDFELRPPLVYKTKDCEFTTVGTYYAFSNVSVSLKLNNANDIYVDLAIQMRLAVFICSATLLLGAVNRSCVETNFFVIKFRNFYLWKDILSAAELLMLGYVFQIATAATGPRKLLKAYLENCGVRSHVYLPFVSLVNLWLFAAMGYFCYAVSLILYLYNALPKYGVMTPDEIAEYKLWLRDRRVEIEQVREYINQAKAAHARVHMMRTAEYQTGRGQSQQVRQLPLDVMARGISTPQPYWTGYPQPETDDYPPMFMSHGSQLPPPQFFGAPSVHGSSIHGGGGPGMPRATDAMSSIPPVNMPRRRMVSESVGAGPTRATALGGM